MDYYTILVKFDTFTEFENRTMEIAGPLSKGFCLIWTYSIHDTNVNQMSTNHYFVVYKRVCIREKLKRARERGSEKFGMCLPAFIINMLPVRRQSEIHRK